MTTRPPAEPPIPDAYVVPGTHLVAGAYPGSPPWPPVSDPEAKLARFLDAGITAFVDLTSTRDPLAPYAEALLELAARRGVPVTHERLTIRDMDVCDAPHMHRILDRLDALLAEERGVYVHCWGGVGRTGTVVGCWLVRHGHDGEEALAEVARLFATMTPKKLADHPEGSPQTTAQRDVVRHWRAQEEARRRDARGRAVDRDTHRAEDAEERALGCLLGGAIGDALGWPVEFLSLESIRQRYGADGIGELDADASGGLGAITDDTQMTLFTAEGILRATAYDVEQRTEGESWNGVHVPRASTMWGAYQRWLRTQDGAHRGHRAGAERGERGEGWLLGLDALHAARAPGNTCLSALRGGVEGSPTSPRNDSKGCGGVMRVAPIGLVPCADPFAYGAMAAALTHGHPSGYLSAGAYAQIVSDLFFGRASLRDAIERALARLATEREHDETSDALRRAAALADEGRPSAARVESLGQGWVGEEALAIGVYCALVADDFAHGVRLAVNHSGDSDSTGSITGALLGVQQGRRAIPAAWLEALELREVIEGVARDLLVGWRDDGAWRARYPGG